jgi:hypothetical protein
MFAKVISYIEYGAIVPSDSFELDMWLGGERGFARVSVSSDAILNTIALPEQRVLSTGVRERRSRGSIVLAAPSALRRRLAEARQAVTDSQNRFQSHVEIVPIPSTPQDMIKHLLSYRWQGGRGSNFGISASVFGEWVKFISEETDTDYIPRRAARLACYEAVIVASYALGYIDRAALIEMVQQNYSQGFLALQQNILQILKTGEPQTEIKPGCIILINDNPQTHTLLCIGQKVNVRGSSMPILLCFNHWDRGRVLDTWDNLQVMIRKHLGTRYRGAMIYSLSSASETAKGV